MDNNALIINFLTIGDPEELDLIMENMQEFYDISKNALRKKRITLKEIETIALILGGLSQQFNISLCWILNKKSDCTIDDFRKKYLTLNVI